MAAAAYVQIITRSEQRRRVWNEALAVAGVSVVGQSGSSHDGLLDVVLTDHAAPPSDVECSATAWQNGVVHVAAESENNCSDTTDQNSPRFEAEGSLRVLLPSDASPREIVLACQLLAAIVRLRRVQRDFGERESRWKQLADADPLTGLMNRRAFTERLVEFLRVSAGTHHCCLALLDLDRFKPVNDEVGHSAGDALLKQVAERLSAAVRKGDLVCRLGGDEFAVALFGVSSEIAGRLIERLRQAASFTEVTAEWPVAASAGWAMLSTALSGCKPSDIGEGILSDKEIDALYRQAYEQADANLRAAKSAGRNRTIPC